MKNYELSVVFHPDLEMNIDPALDKVKKIIEVSGGKITNEENEGKKRLSYSIQGQDFGIYYFFNVELSPDAPAKIENALNITDEVIRHMLVKEDPRKAKYEALRQAKTPEEEVTTEEKGE